MPNAKQVSLTGNVMSAGFTFEEIFNLTKNDNGQTVLSRCEQKETAVSAKGDSL